MTKYLFFRPKLLLGLVLFAYAIFIILFSWYVPLWDSWAYLGIWLSQAINQPFNLFNFDAFGHPTLLYHFLLAIPQYLDRENLYLLFLTIIFLTIFMAYAFYRIAKRMFPEKSLQNELIGLTYIFVFMPIIVANAINHSPDYGKMAFILILIWSLWDKRKLLAFFSALMLAFSKEQGVAMLLGTIAVAIYFDLKSRKQMTFPDIKKAFFSYAVYTVPVFIWVFYLLLKHVRTNSPIIWEESMLLLDPRSYTSIPRTLSYLAGIFIINFHWILTLFAAVGVLVILRLKIINSIKAYHFNAFAAQFISSIFIVSFVILTMVRHITRLRFFLPLYPLLLLLFYLGLITVFPKDSIRRIVLVVISLLFYIAIFYRRSYLQIVLRDFSFW